MNKVKDFLNKRGSETLRTAGKIFRQLNSYDNNSKVSKEDFSIGLRELSINLNKQDIEVNLISTINNIYRFWLTILKKTKMGMLTLKTF